MKNYFYIFAEGLFKKRKPFKAVALFKISEAYVFALAFARGGVVNNKNVVALVVPELCKKPEFALCKASVAVRAENINVGRLVGF